jgi:hypothetical protein
MPIRFKAVQKAQPGVPGGGKKKYYAVPVMNGEWDIERLTRAISHSPSASIISPFVRLTHFAKSSLAR